MKPRWRTSPRWLQPRRLSSPPDAPIIVESASLARMRLSEAAAEAAADDEAVEKTPEEKMGFIRLSEGAFQLPTTDLLEYIPPPAHDMDKQQLYEMAERLEQAMSNYGVRGKVKEIHMGPVVTMYEFAPAPGTRTGKIANLEKDLAMALEAQAVRIVAPIPGKAVVGVEVPNLTREIVYLKEILQDNCFTGAASKLQVALGKDIKGAPVTREPLQDAAPAGRRNDRLGQVGRRQRDDHQHPLQRLARRGPLHHGRPQDAGALDLRGDPAPPAAGGDRSQEGEPGAALGGRRDGAPLRAPGQDRRARRRQLQRQDRRRQQQGSGAGGACPQGEEDPRRPGRPRRDRAGGRSGRRRRDHRRRGGRRRWRRHRRIRDAERRGSLGRRGRRAGDAARRRRRRSRPSSPTS